MLSFLITSFLIFFFFISLLVSAFIYVSYKLYHLSLNRLAQNPLNLWQDSKNNTLDPNHHYKISEHQIKIDEYNIHYSQCGAGPYLLLIHGIGASRFVWRKLIEELAPHHTLILLDLPGFGESSELEFKPMTLKHYSLVLQKFIEQLNLNPVDIVASSMGAKISMQIKLDNPKLLNKMIFIAPAFSPLLVPRWTKILNAIKNYYFLVHSKSIQVSLKRILHNKHSIDDTLIDVYIQPYLKSKNTWKNLINGLNILREKHIQKNIEQNKCSELEFLIIYSTHDKMVPAKYIEKIKIHLPKVNFDKIESLGHHPFEENPRLIAHKISQYLKHSS